MYEYISLGTDAWVIWTKEHGMTIILVLISVLLIRLIMGQIIEKVIRKLIPSRAFNGSTIAERKREDTLIRIVQGTFGILIWILAGLMILSEVGVNIGPLIAAAGVVGLAVGFGGQYLIKDLISGLFIILENQYRIGDVVCFDSICGSVEDISLRATTLRNLDGTVHHIPHGTVDRVSNMSKQFARVNLNLRISYRADLEHVIHVINETGAIMAADEYWRPKILKPIAFQRVDDFGESALIVKVLGDTLPLEQWAVAGEFRKRIKIAFDQAGIEIPFQQIVVHSR